MYRKSLVIKEYKNSIAVLKSESQELLINLPKEKDWNSFRILLDKYNSTLAKIHVIQRKIENLNNGLPTLGRSIDSAMDIYNNSEE